MAKKTKEFKHDLPEFIPFRDKEVCERVRAIKKEDICRHPNSDFKIRIIEDDDQFNFEYVLDIFSRIKKASDENKRLVLIFPQLAPKIYGWVAHLINKLKVNCKNLYVFNMDEKADGDGKTPSPEWGDSFAFHLKSDCCYM